MIMKGGEKMKKNYLVLIGIFLISFVFAQTYQYGMMGTDGQFYPNDLYGFGGGMMSMMYGSYGIGMMLFGWAFMLLISVALVLLIIWLLKQIKKKR
jgi:peptidoglycan/LPS O-acetylase OafA/YrhL